MKTERKNELGITLIALVITIIVLLILAGVTVQTLTGDNGLLQKAETAKEESEEAKELELVKLAVSAVQVEGEGNLNTEKLQNALLEEFQEELGVLSGDGGWIYTGKLDNYNISSKGIVSKQISNIKIYGNNTQIPNDYQELYFIGKESQEDSWIDPNIEIDLTSEVIFESAFMFDIKNQWYDGPVNGAVAILGHYSIPNIYNSIIFGDKKYSHWEGIAGTNVMATYKLNKNGITVKKDGSGEQTLSYLATSASGKVYPLGSPERINSRGYIHAFQHYKNGNLESNLVSCYRKSDGEIGMYDFITDTFYTNQGTGTVLKGKNIGLGKIMYTNKDDQFSIPVKITTISGEENINIILTSPLRKEQDTSDYLDLKNKKIVRYIDENNNILSIPIEENINIENLPEIEEIVGISVDANIEPSKIEMCE